MNIGEDLGLGGSDAEGDDQLGSVMKELDKVEKLSPDQVSLCQYRHMLLCYLDRLSTYEVSKHCGIATKLVCYFCCHFLLFKNILDGPTAVEKVFEFSDYSTFRSDNLVQSAIFFARVSLYGVNHTLLIFTSTMFQDGDWSALETLLTYHGDVLLPHRLATCCVTSSLVIFNFRLAILFNFPETTPPKTYRSLLPAVR